MARQSTLVLISGLQGTGKTTLATAVAQTLQAALLSRDPLMKTLKANHLPEEGIPVLGVPRVPVLGYQLQTALLEQHLGAGLPVVMECVMTKDIQRAWIELGSTYSARVVTVECTCSDRGLHRSRIQDRYRAGESSIRWQMVARAPKNYRTFEEPDYIADAIHPLESHIRQIMARIG